MTPRASALICRGRGFARCAFTLLEMLVSVSILVVIIFSLYQMFNQTQRAFRGGVTQVDVMEAGRVAMNMIATEVSQSAATHVGDATNFYWRANPLGFVTPLVQTLVDGTLVTNELQEFYFLSRPNGAGWQGQGFFLDTNQLPAPTAVFGPGTLYRLRTNGIALSPDVMARVIAQAATGNTRSCFPVCEGVIHFKIRPLRADGSEIPNSSTLTGDDLPHYVAVELGLLDPTLLSQVRSIGTVAAYTNFLSAKAGNVQVFQQTIPIRAAVR